MKITTKAISGLALIYALRMFGLFLILPVFSIYAATLEHSTEILTGIALGIYGISQGVMQMPMGALSDIYGRKKIITIGIIVFMIGSMIAAFSDSIYMMILARVLQGAGAIAAATMALVSDFTSEKSRPIAMAIIGSSIGLMFVLAVIVGPLLNQYIDVPQIFYFITALAALALLVLWFWVPDQPQSSQSYGRMFSQLKPVLRDSKLLTLNSCIFLLHAALMAFFIVFPKQLLNVYELGVGDHWKLYLPALGGALLILVPILGYHRRHHHRTMSVMSLASVIMLMGCGLFVFTSINLSPLWVLTGALWLFFSGFTVLEAMLPSLVATLAGSDHRGAALGVFNSFEFIGIFVGASLAGVFISQFGMSAVYGLVFAFVALMLAINMMQRGIDQK